MASLSVTVPDSVVGRILIAYGHWDDVKKARVPATPAELRVTLKEVLKAMTLEYEAGLAAQAVRDIINAEVW